MPDPESSVVLICMRLFLHDYRISIRYEIWFAFVLSMEQLWELNSILHDVGGSGGERGMRRLDRVVVVVVGS